MGAGVVRRVYTVLTRTHPLVHTQLDLENLFDVLLDILEPAEFEDAIVRLGWLNLYVPEW